MKPFTLFALAFILFSCDPKEKIVTPDPSIKPPEWIRGTWIYSDSTNYTEKLIISNNDIIKERIINSDQNSISFIDSCKDNSITIEESVKYNIYYHIEFKNKNDNINHIYLAKIGGNEIRLINGVSPTTKSYVLED